MLVASIAALTTSAAEPSLRDGRMSLPVPVVRQARQRCGPAALEMVLRFHHASPAALAAAARAYDPVLRGTLVTDLARAARKGGLEAAVERVSEDSLRALLARRLPPILLFDAGTLALSRQHYGVLVGWDPDREVYVLHDGGARPRLMRRNDLLRRWRSAGGLAVVVRPPGTP
jgi:ABC-type bacteriocin/lantibiotic exporter with double-glycine peptidase domain